ncbi:unnamed protein product [Mytilus edulis]|uniref:Mab-21-like HhH/H2TH-like domain-containing protein n=1 Tax=Mytilus edulis TaxID=6550 RepID=A0A8S3Q3D1_MYTED|nr:unnamed protein product [Mytilus edulis]
MYSEEEEDSNWLFDVLERITSEILLSVKALFTSNLYGRSCGATVTQLHNDGCGKTSQKAAMICEIPDTFDNTVTWYNTGSAFEGTVTPDVPNDLDFIRCQEWPSVIQEIAKDEEDDKFSLLIVRDTNTPDGYVKLQLVKGKTPLTSAHRPSLKDNFPNMHPCFKIDKSQRLVLCDFLMTYDGKHMFSREKNKPAVKHVNYYGLNADNVISYRCKTWPSMANEWLTRLRVNDWPSKDMIQDMKSLGFFVVRKGHPFSRGTDLEWRISLSLQERKLVYNLTNVQHKCYVFLKMINRDIINLECITSYHWKTCLFYLIEGNNEVIWQKQFLFHCVKLCIAQMLEWVECRVCPNYFIPAENLFDGRLTDSLRIISKRKLDGLLKDGFSFLLSVSSNNICDYVKSRNYITRHEWLQTKCGQAYITALYIAETSTFRIVHSVFNQIILPYYCKQTNDVHSNFLKFLWISKDRIQNISTITEHTAQEVQNGLDLLLPCFSTCLASNISALALSITKFDTRAFCSSDL